MKRGEIGARGGRKRRKKEWVIGRYTQTDAPVCVTLWRRARQSTPRQDRLSSYQSSSVQLQNPKGTGSVGQERGVSAFGGAACIPVVLVTGPKEASSSAPVIPKKEEEEEGPCLARGDVSLCSSLGKKVQLPSCYVGSFSLG